MDGASRFAEFRYVVMPTLRPIIALVVVLRLIWTFNDFELPYLLTGGGPGTATLTLPTLTYNLAFPSDEMNLATGIGVLLLLGLGLGGVAYVRNELARGDAGIRRSAA
jgi:multiple sugar transport system permease protein